MCYARSVQMMESGLISERLKEIVVSALIFVRVFKEIVVLVFGLSASH